jgi:hypothetical protein
MNNLKYLTYVLRHKYFVAKECFKKGLYWQGITHDLSKLYPSEFIPYSSYFNRKEVFLNAHGESEDPAFNLAWFIHQKRNKHHWQYWILPAEGEGARSIVFEMPENYIVEMICDWAGAGRAQGFVSPEDDIYFETRSWYQANKNNMQLHEKTREIIERILFHK